MPQHGHRVAEVPGGLTAQSLVLRCCSSSDAEDENRVDFRQEPEQVDDRAVGCRVRAQLVRDSMQPAAADLACRQVRQAAQEVIQAQAFE